VEKCETSAIGRALAALGIGTQFVGQDLSEDDQVADAPVEMRPRTVKTKERQPVHPTPDQISSLIELALSCGHSLDQFAKHVREYLKAPNATRETLPEQMNLEQYDNLWKGYQQELAKIAEAEERSDTYNDVTDYPPPESAQIDAKVTPNGNGPVDEEGSTTGNADALNVEEMASAADIGGLQTLAAAVKGDLGAEVQQEIQQYPHGQYTKALCERRINELRAEQHKQMTARKKA
jgi:hypothetical protein